MERTAPGARASAIAGALFVLLIAAANWLTAQLGMVPLFWGLSVAAGTAAAGLVLLVRDVIHDAAGVVAVLVCIALGGALSYMVAGPSLAVASAVAFTFAEVCDLLVYSPLRSRGWGRAAFWSGVAGAVPGDCGWGVRSGAGQGGRDRGCGRWGGVGACCISGLRRPCQCVRR